MNTSLVKWRRNKKKQMLGISYGELFLLVGATAALIGPKDLPLVARTAGRLAGRAIGYVQVARGQFDSIMQQTQARQVHKELRDTMAQLEAIRHEIRSISFVNPGPLTRTLVNDDNPSSNGGGSSTVSQETANKEYKSRPAISKDCSPVSSDSLNMYNQATTFARFAETQALKPTSTNTSTQIDKMNNEPGLLAVLPISAETSGLLPKRSDSIKGSDIVLEAIVEAEVANKAKEFFSQPQNQIISK